MLHHQSFFDHLVAFVPKVLPLIDPAVKNSYYPRTFDNYPNLSFGDNGFPKVSLYPSKVDVSDFFRSGYNGRKAVIDLYDFDEYPAIIETLVKNPQIESYYGVPKVTQNGFDLLKFNCENLVISIIERYYYQHGVDFSVANLLKLFKPLDVFLSSEKIHFDIGVPLLFIKFDLEYFELTENIAIRRISNEAHRARHKIVGYSPAIVDSVFMSATHELVLKDYHYQRPESWHQSPFSQAQIYPKDIVQKVLSILHLVTNYDTGYAQFLIYPHNWTNGFFMDLIQLTGASARAYPSYFDDYHWNKSEFPIVSSTQATLVKDLFIKAQNCNENKLEFALRRFYKSIMREEEEDVVVDLIVALEMLLSDNEKSEITHKLALRIAGLIGKYAPNEYSPLQVFANVKQIYAYRSSIVHGSHKVNKKREIKLEENKSVPSVDLARLYLSEVLKILISNPQYFDPGKIDQILLQQTTVQHE